MSSHAQSDGTEDFGSTWKSDSLDLPPGIAARSSAIAELPLGEYLHSRQNLKYEGVYFPLGYPVRVVCNSARVLEAAEQSWSCFDPVFHGEPLEILLEVRNAAGIERSTAARSHTHAHGFDFCWKSPTRIISSSRI